MRDFSRNKVPGELHGINLSDIHFIHRQTPTPNLILQCTQLIRNENPATLDVITLSGDVFDRITSFITDDVIAFRAWGTWLLRYCKEHNIILDILEGTASHDQEQSKWFIEQNKAAEIGAHVLYYNELCIVDEPFGMKVLYLPDNWSHDPDVTFQDVITQINQHGVPDFILMHGAFDYQLPEIAQRDNCVHDSEAYNELVRPVNGWIISGHIHLKSECDRIKVGGSVGRLAHNEEGPKGMLRYVLREDFQDTWTFVENKLADTYLTLRMHGITDEELPDVLAKGVHGLEKGSHVQIKCRKDDVAAQSFRSITVMYPDIIWTLNPDKQSTKSLLGNAFVQQTIERGADLTKDNTPRLILERIKQKHPMVDHLALSRWLENVSP